MYFFQDWFFHFLISRKNLDLEQGQWMTFVSLCESTLSLILAFCHWFGMQQVHLEKQLTKTGMIVLTNQFLEPEKITLVLVLSYQYKVHVLSAQFLSMI